MTFEHYEMHQNALGNVVSHFAKRDKKQIWNYLCIPWLFSCYVILIFFSNLVLGRKSTIFGQRVTMGLRNCPVMQIWSFCWGKGLHMRPWKATIEDGWVGKAFGTLKMMRTKHFPFVLDLRSRASVLDWQSWWPLLCILISGCTARQSTGAVKFLMETLWWG